jgi:hypothetical protein
MANIHRLELTRCGAMQFQTREIRLGTITNHSIFHRIPDAFKSAIDWGCAEIQGMDLAAKILCDISKKNMTLVSTPEQGMVKPEQESGSTARRLGVKMRNFHTILKSDTKKLSVTKTMNIIFRIFLNLSCMFI